MYTPGRISIMNQSKNFMSRISDWLLTIPFLKNWLSKHPKVKEQLVQHFSSKEFGGLPLTIFIVLFLCISAFLMGTIQDFLSHESLAIDLKVEHFFYNLRSQFLLRLFYFLTLFAEPGVSIILILVMTVLFFIYRERLYIFTLWFAFIIGEGLTTLGKYAFHRERPDIALRAITENSFSFPSGHATTVIIIYGVIAYIAVKSFKSWEAKAASVFSFIFLVLLVDISRLYLGVHYLSDIIAGNLVGLAALIFSLGITESIVAKKQKMIPVFEPLEITILIGAIIASVISFYYLVPILG